MTRTPEERERMRAWLYNSMHPQYGWTALSELEQAPWVERFAGLLARCPQLWDSLPPDPEAVAREQARMEAEEDRVMVEKWRIQSVSAPIDLGRAWASAAVQLADKISARAARFSPDTAPLILGPTKGEGT